MQYVKHKTKKGVNKAIIPPTPEEILKDDFDYSKYIDEYLNIEIDYEKLEEMYYSISENKDPVDPNIQKLYENYENEIISVQLEYEQNTVDKESCIKKMKIIAQKYFENLQKLVKFKLQKENEYKELSVKRQELVNALNQMLKVKENIELNAQNRLNAFINREIPLGKLHIYDLTKLQTTELYRKHYRALSKYRLHVFANLLDTEGVYYKPIEQLNIKGKK